MGAKSLPTSSSDENARNERRPLQERAMRKCVPSALAPNSTYSLMQQELTERKGEEPLRMSFMEARAKSIRRRELKETLSLSGP